MFYTSDDCSYKHISLSITNDPLNVTVWNPTGFIFPYELWSKSGVVLFASPENELKQHYLFWGDSQHAPLGGIGKFLVFSRFCLDLHRFSIFNLDCLNFE